MKKKKMKKEIKRLKRRVKKLEPVVWDIQTRTMFGPPRQQ